MNVTRQTRSGRLLVGLVLTFIGNSACEGDLPEEEASASVSFQPMRVQALPPGDQPTAQAELCNQHLEFGRHYLEHDLLVASQQRLEEALDCGDDILKSEACGLLLWVVAIQSNSESQFLDQMRPLDCVVPAVVPFRWSGSEDEPATPAEADIGAAQPEVVP